MLTVNAQEAPAATTMGQSVVTVNGLPAENVKLAATVPVFVTVPV